MTLVVFACLRMCRDLLRGAWGGAVGERQGHQGGIPQGSTEAPSGCKQGGKQVVPKGILDGLAAAVPGLCIAVSGLMPTCLTCALQHRCGSQPDAKDRFQEAKAAFETLSDANMRAEYDRRLRFGDASSWAGGRSGFGSSGYGGYSSSGGYGQRKPKPEDDYSFDDFLKDLDKEFSGWASERSSKRKGAAPKSLWEELEGIGEVR
eukprot:156346-Chlamydomonas_euryale.AAC.4